MSAEVSSEFNKTASSRRTCSVNPNRVFHSREGKTETYNAAVAEDSRALGRVCVRGQKAKRLRPSHNSDRFDREEWMKHIKNIGILTVVVLVTVLLTLAFSAAAAPRLATQPVSIAAVPAAALATPLPGPHPEIHAALEAMRNAKDHLEHAAHDFNGHRVESIKHLDAAIHEAEICEHMD